MKRSILLLLALLLIVPISASVSAQDGPSIALFNPLGDNDYIVAAEKGVREIVEGAGGTVQAFNAGFDPAEQLNQIQDAITAGTFDAFIIYSVDGVGVTVGVDAAAEAGIPVISLDAPIGPDRQTLVPYKNIAAQIARTGLGDGKYIGDAIVSACEGVDPCKVAFLIGFEGFPLDLDRLAAVEAIVAEHSNISIVTTQAASYTAEEGNSVTANILQANPDINVIASVGDQMIVGAELAAEDAGIEGIKYIGQGGSIDGYEAVSEGRWFATIANIPYTNGKIAGQMALQAIDGTLIVRSVDMYNQAPPFPPSGPIITQENAAEFTPEW
jgi:ribose transport system substrate-binding protein